LGQPNETKPTVGAVGWEVLLTGPFYQVHFFSRFDRDTCSGQNAFRICRVRAIWLQFQVLLVGLGASGRQKHLLGRWIDGGLGNECLPLEVIQRGSRWIERDGLFRRSELRIGISNLKEHNRFVATILSCLLGKRGDCVVESFFRVLYLAFVRIDLSQARPRHALDVRGAALGVVDCATHRIAVVPRCGRSYRIAFVGGPVELI